MSLCLIQMTATTGISAAFFTATDWFAGIAATGINSWALGRLAGTHELSTADGSFQLLFLQTHKCFFVQLKRFFLFFILIHDKVFKVVKIGWHKISTG